MSLVTRNNQTETFVPAGDSFLEEYISEINQPKQAQPTPDLPDDSEFTDLEELVEEKAPSAYAQKRGRTTARFAVGTLDKIISSMVAVYAHSDDVTEFQAGDEDLEDLAEQWGVYFTESNLDLPPWVFALITTGFVLMKKMKAAGSLRKINIERKKYKVENEALKNQIELLNQKNTMLQLKKKVEELENKSDQSQ